MAKKRVHEIAKARGITSKEVIAALNAAGIEVKAAASSVEESVANEILDGKKPAAAKPAAPMKAPAKPKAAAKPAAKPATKAPEGKQAKPAPGKKPAGKPAADGKKKAEGKQEPSPIQAIRGRKFTQPSAAPPPNAGIRKGKVPPPRKVRRVVIDSQASRRDVPSQPGPARPPRRRGGRRRRPLLEEPTNAPATEPQKPAALVIPSGATVREVAETLGVSSAEVIKKLMQLGEMATLTQTLPDETIVVLADEFNQEVEIKSAAEEGKEEVEHNDAPEDLEVRPPVVTIMGHVDHGKTSLLDAIRETEVAATEAGGITQHIGAYQVHKNGKTITFIDTPGHEAFTAMRARGAEVTDIVIIVVAADDGVMPQTIEAIDHAKAAGVPIIVAVNKIDKPGADPDRVRGELAGHGLTPEDWGGDTIFVNVSAKTGEGLGNLLEMLLLVAEVEDFRANPNASASGAVIESHLDSGRGPVATVLIQRGTMRVGDALVAGPQWGKVRAMQDFTGHRVKAARPGDPVEVLGFEGVCEAGQRVEVVESDKRARQIAQAHAHRLKSEAIARRQARRVSLEDVFARAKQGEMRELPIILKSDVSGSLEALQDEIAKVPQDEVQINIVHAQTGGINASDIMLAATSNAIVIGFNVRPLPDVKRIADAEGVEIRTYSVIYKVTEDLRAALEGLLDPEEVEEEIGEVEVRDLFRASKVGTIAGCVVTEGRIARDAEVRLIRDGTVIWTGKLESLKRFKDDVREVTEGQDCGIVLDGFQDVKVGDTIEAFYTRKVEKTLQ